MKIDSNNFFYNFDFIKASKKFTLPCLFNSKRLQIIIQNLTKKGLEFKIVFQIYNYDKTTTSRN